MVHFNCCLIFVAFFILFSDATLYALLDESNVESKRIVVTCIRSKRDEDIKDIKASMVPTHAAYKINDKLIVEGVHLYASSFIILLPCNHIACFPMCLMSQMRRQKLI